MRTIGVILLVSVALAQLSAQEIVVRSVERPDNDFDRYKTYTWASQVDETLDAGNYFLNDLVLKADIRDAVKGELEGRGYKNEPESPDLLVNFRVFNEAVTLKGYESYGASYWGDVEFRTPADTTTHRVEPGTLIISMIDKKNGSIVWQGFASGLINNNEFIKEEGKVREAVHLIFEEYPHRATEYTKR